MPLPKDAELLGATTHELHVHGLGAHTFIELSGDEQRRLLALLAESPAQAPPHQVYLALENIRGTHDATVLNAYLNLPEGAAPGECRHLEAGSAALYGLRRASAQRGETQGQGLASMFDITPILRGLRADHSFNPGKIRVGILPHRALPEGVDIVVGRIAIFTLPPK